MMKDYNLMGFYILRLGVVYGVFFILLAFNVIDVPLIGSQSGRLSFLLMGLYFWTVFRPSLIPYPLVFVMGLLLDLLAGGLVGLHAFSFMVMAMVVQGQRRFLLGQSWSVVWAGFCVAVMAVLLFHTLVYFIADRYVPDLITMGFNMMISFLLYPLFLPLMMFLNRWLSDG